MQKKIKLSELGQFKNGLNFSKIDVEKPCKMIGVSNFSNYLFPKYTELDSIDSSLVPKEFLLEDGDIVFVRSNGNKNLVGRSMYISNSSEKITFSGFCIRFRPDKEKVNPLFLFYLLRAPGCRKQYSYSQQTNITNLSQDVLGGVSVILPSLEKQKVMAEMLYKLDLKIENNNAINDNLEQMANQLFEHWFVQFKFPSSNNEMSYNDAIKMSIPANWSATTVSELLGKVPNTLRIQSSEYATNGELPIVDQSSNFIAGYTNMQDSLLYDEHGYIVFGDHTRVVKYIRFPFARGADGTQIMKSDLKNMPTELFYQIVKHIDLSNHGYARHFKFLKESVVIVPDEKTAQLYANTVIPWYEEQVNIQIENRKLVQLRDWLLPMLMNGQATIED